jgi:hypothetical protein
MVLHEENDNAIKEAAITQSNNFFIQIFFPGELIWGTSEEGSVEFVHSDRKRKIQSVYCFS